MDTEGLLLGVSVHPADISDRAGAERLLLPLEGRLPRLSVIWADHAYNSRSLTAWVQKHLHARVEVVSHPTHVYLLKGEQPQPKPWGFRVLPRRWVVERTFGWQGRSRRLSKDYEGLPSSEEAFIYLSMVMVMVRRLAL